MVEVVFLGVNDIGNRIYEWLTDQDDVTVLAMVTEPHQLSIVEELSPDLLVSAGFRHIVPERVLEIPRLGAVNLHKSYLPHNRGANPNVWSIVDDAPAGVSIHYMTPAVDAGPIVARDRVQVRPSDDARDLYERLEEAQFEQFVRVWPEIRDDDVETVSQDPDDGSYHYKQDFVDLWEINLDETIRVGDFIDRLRALTFPPYQNAYFEIDGERYYVDLQIGQENEDSTADLDSKNVPTYTENEQE